MAYVHYTGAKSAIYCGGVQYQGNELKLASYDRGGEWIAEQKEDGWWICIEWDGVGELKMTSRSGKPIDAPIVVGMFVGLPRLVVCGEFVGDDSVRLFDCLVLGKLMLNCQSYNARRAMLEAVYGKMNTHARKVFSLVQRWGDGFIAAYRSVVANGGEGLMLKKKSSTACPSNQAGKIDEWVKVKKMETQDVVLVGFHRTPKNGITGAWGMWNTVSKKFIEVMRGGVLGFELEDRGKFLNRVAEFEGFEVQDSGALASPHFVRWRDDKVPCDCVLPSTSVNKKVARFNEVI